MSRNSQNSAYRAWLAGTRRRAAERLAGGGDFIPCIIHTHIYGLCGHSVYTTQCNDLSKVLVNGEWQDASTACDDTCRMHQLEPSVYEQGKCPWCLDWPEQPNINASRSDPGADILGPDEVDVRRRQHMLRPLLPAERADLEGRYERYVMLGVVRLIRQRRIEASQIQNQVPMPDRLYFFGEGYDDRALLAPVTDFDGILGATTCSICRSAVDFRTQSRDVVQLPCRHAWHRRCLIPWFQGNDVGSCPACRAVYQLAGDDTDVDEFGNRIN